MNTLHRILSFRFPLASCFFALSIAFFATRPPAARAQQPNNPTPNPDCGGPSITTTPTNAGTDFLLCFEENIDAGYDNSGYLEVYVASLGDTATVTITSKLHPSLNKVFFLQRNSSLSYRISDDSDNGQPMHDLWIVSDEIADNTVVEVQATSPVVCYGMDYKIASADAFCAIDSDAAGTDYEVMSYPNSQGESSQSESPTSTEFAVAAFADNTTVTITPAALTLHGNPAGVPFTVVLQKGQCVQIQTNPNIDSLDLTGSIVSANRPITVYGGHVRTEAPLGWIGPDGISRDMLLEVMPPTSTWGANFVLNAIALDSKGTIGPSGDLMRALALDSNTVVTVNGNPWVTLGSKQHPSLFSDSLISGPTLVTSTGPLLIGEIEHSDYVLKGGDGNGDPSLSIVPPVDQTYNNYTFFLSDSNFSFQSVIIATDTRSQGNIILDGTPIPSAAFTPVPGSLNGQTFSIFEYPFTNPSGGAHTISTSSPPEQGFTILAYGLDDDISYGYTAGELLIPKRAIRIEYPPQSIGLGHSNSLNFHNTAYQPAYLDSAVFIPDNPNASAFGIHVAENVGLDIGRVDVGGSSQIHLVSDNPLSDPVSGTVKIYSHLPSYFNIEPAEMSFTLYPNAGAAADVAGTGGLSLTLTATPNPFSAYTTINFSVPETADITMTLYDELGRAVQHITSSEFSAGPYSVRIERRGLANGVYVCELTSNKLNLHERIPIVAGE